MFHELELEEMLITESCGALDGYQSCDDVLNGIPFLVAFVGTSGSGKTTAMECITADLTKLGINVGVAKHIHAEGFTIDTEGKDTWRHARAGARMVLGVSPNELAIIRKTATETVFRKVIGEFKHQAIDTILLEGFSTSSKNWRDLPKVVTAKNRLDLKYTLARTPSPILAITGQVIWERQKIEKSRAPLVDLLRERPVLTSIIRRLIRPREERTMLREAAEKHGDTCIGLAIGVRAAYLASCAFTPDRIAPDSVTCGTKECIVEAMRTIYPNSSIRVKKIRDDSLELRSSTTKLSMRLIPKERAVFRNVRDVLKARHDAIFQDVKCVAR